MCVCGNFYIVLYFCYITLKKYMVEDPHCVHLRSNLIINIFKYDSKVFRCTETFNIFSDITTWILPIPFYTICLSLSLQ